jgi:ADP-heptose:LPS heptosyltransferase
MIAKAPGRGDRGARLLDRYVGIPLVFLAGLYRRKRPIPAHPHRIGLLNTAAIGDTVLMSGPLADLRTNYPRAEIVFLSGPSNYEAASLLKGTDIVIKVPVFNPLAAIRAVREQKIDLFLDFGPWCRVNAIIAIFSGADFIAGFRTSAQGRHFGYDLVVDHSEDAHEFENQRGLIRALGIIPQHAPSLPCEHPESENVRDFFGRFAVFHLWPGGSAAGLKQWPVGRWVALAEDLAADQYDVVFTGASHQRPLNDAVIAEVKASLRPRIKNSAGLSLGETLRLLSRAELVVSVDTGVMHMAAATRVPLVALHGPSSPHRWGPVSQTAIVVEPRMPGCGFLNLGFEKLRNAPACMNAISYGTVKTACAAALGRKISECSMPAPTHAWSSRGFPPIAPAGVWHHHCAGQRPQPQNSTQSVDTDSSRVSARRANVSRPL